MYLPSTPRPRPLPSRSSPASAVFGEAIIYTNLIILSTLAILGGPNNSSTLPAVRPDSGLPAVRRQLLGSLTAMQYTDRRQFFTRLKKALWADQGTTDV